MIETIESSRAASGPHWLPTSDEGIDWWGSLPFFSMHAACLLVFWAGVSPAALILCLAMYWIRMFAITAGYHRYFSHASFKTSRAFQFFLALLGTSAAQMGPLWWAAHHRRHHRFSDTERDTHSPILRGLWWAHVGWILCKKNEITHFEEVQGLAKFPELRFLNRYYALPPFILAVLTFILGEVLAQRVPQLGSSGFQMLVWGFFISTVILYHGTFTINSLAHVFGSRRFDTKDGSRNNFCLALLTMGEGWHNNHHRHPAAERQGYYWWEIDMTHYILKILSWVGIVWDLRAPPDWIYLSPAAQ
jgi:stearoyl-CoA desaturase (delta-9 desaturase)